MILICTKLSNMNGHVVGCVSLKLLSQGKTYQPATPFSFELEKRHNHMVAVLEKAWGIKSLKIS
jgi:hypothetical protein